MQIKFFKPRQGQRSLADFTIEFNEPGSLLEGHSLGGFSIWQRRQDNGEGLPYSITGPARQYTDKDGNRAFWDFLRVQNGEDSRYRSRFLRQVIDAFERWESQNSRSR